ncbi:MULTISPECIES: hypothetical protein [unclassified Modestobacter]
MRWEQLFADLEAQAADQEAAELDAESASRSRAELGRVHLADRLRGAVGAEVVLTCAGVGELAGRLVEVGVDWLLLTDVQQRELLVATRAVRAVGGLTTLTVDGATDGTQSRLDLRRALRGLARDRATVQCLLDDGSVFAGTVDRVGADHLELAEHAVDRPRRRGAVSGVRAIVLAAVVAVRTLPPAVV